MAGYDVQVLVNGSLLEQCNVALPLTITHGRSSTISQPDSPTCQFDWLGTDPPGVVGDLVEVGRPSADQAQWGDDLVTWVDGEYTWTGTRDLVPKFVGSLVAVEARESGGVVDGWTVYCVGRQAALGRIKVSMVRPVETDVQRVQAIAAEVGYVLNVMGTSSLLLSADTIQTNALAALHQICESSGGMLWQGRSGDLWYGAANHRAEPVDNQVDCKVIRDGIAWTNDHENIVNEVTITWGQESASDKVAAVWNYRTGDTTIDPGTGNVTSEAVAVMGHVTPQVLAATHWLAFNRVDANGYDIGPVLRQLSNGIAIRGQVKNDGDTYARWVVDGAVVDNGTWLRVPVGEVDSGGDPIGNNTDLLFRFGSTAQEQETYRDDDSVAEWGLRHLDVQTLLYDETQAGQLALLILGRRAQPWWRMPGVLIDYADTTGNQAARLDAMDVSEGATLPVPPEPGPTPADLAQWTIEGWVEEWGAGGHLLQLALTDRRRTGSTGIRSWQGMLDADVPGATDWAYWQARKWQDVLIKGVGEV